MNENSTVADLRIGDIGTTITATNANTKITGTLNGIETQTDIEEIYDGMRTNRRTTVRLTIGTARADFQTTDPVNIKETP